MTDNLDGLADLLPDDARRKIKLWRERREDLHGSYLKVSERLENAAREYNRAEARFRNEIEPAYRAGRLKKVEVLKEGDPGFPYMKRGSGDAVTRETVTRIEPDDARLAEERARVDRRRRERDDLRERAARLGDQMQAWAGPLSEIEAYLKLVRRQGVTITPWSGAVRPARGDTADKIRAKIEALHTELRTVREAPLPQGEAMASLRRQVEKIAEDGRPDLTGLLAHGDRIRWPTATGEVLGATADGMQTVSRGSIPDSNALIAWLFMDELTARLEAELADMIGPRDNGLSRDERRRREARLMADILAAERIEEAVIEAAERDGHAAIPRRREADPRAVLGLSDNLPRMEDLK